MQLYAHGIVAGRVVCGVGSYVIPWESRVNSCHLRFSCSEFYADSKKKSILFLDHLNVIF